MSGKKWSYSAGSKPYTIVVYEREPGGTLYIRAWDPTKSRGNRPGGWIRKSLGHRDREVATAYALEQAGKLRKGDAELQRGEGDPGPGIRLIRAPPDP